MDRKHIIQLILKFNSGLIQHTEALFASLSNIVAYTKKNQLQQLKISKVSVLCLSFQVALKGFQKGKGTNV